MMVGNELQVFSFDGKQTRVTVVDGEPWVVAKDVAVALDYGLDSKVGMLFKHVPDEWKGVNPIYTPGGEQNVLCLSEQGLYFFLGRSDKPKAVPYQKWIAGEVVPSNRKHGAYMTPDVLARTITDPDFLIGLLQELKSEQEKSKVLTKQNQQLKGKNDELETENQELYSSNRTLKLQRLRDSKKVQFADAVTASKSHILVGALAKILKQNGVDIGQNRLFKWLRENGYLAKRGNNYNLPTQKAMELGLFFVKEVKVDMGDMGVSIKKTPMITGKVQQYFINLFLSDSEDEE